MLERASGLDDGMAGCRLASLRIMTYNLRAGLGAAGSCSLGERPDEETLEPIAALIEAWQPDLVALQEVIIFDGRHGPIDQAGWLARRLGMTARFGPVTSLRPSGFWGNALLSRFPFQTAQTYRLDRETPTDPRSLLEAQVRINDRVVTCYSVHLSYRPHETVRQVRRMAPIVRAALAAGPVVLAGDFNSHACSPELAELPLRDRDTFTLLGVAPDDPCRSTFPAGELRHRALDHIFVSDELEPRFCQVVVDQTGASDHNPVVADLLISVRDEATSRALLSAGHP